MWKIKKIIEHLFGICFHEYKKYGNLPKMIDDPNCSAAFIRKYKCEKCGKLKETWSDLHAGVRIIDC